MIIVDMDMVKLIHHNQKAHNIPLWPLCFLKLECFSMTVYNLSTQSCSLMTSVTCVSTGQEELKPTTASMSSTHTKYKAELCINGKDDGPDKGADADMCSTQDTWGGKKADPAPWIALDFGDEARVSVGKVVLANRINCCGKRTAKVEVRLANELPADGASMFTDGKLLGEFAGPGENGQKIEIESEEGWEGTVGRYLIVQMDKSDKPDSLNLKEVTAFGKAF